MFSEAKTSPYAASHSSFGGVTKQMRAGGLSSAPLDTIKFIREILFNLDVISHEELETVKNAKGFTGKKQAMLAVLRANQDGINAKADDITQAVEGSLDDFISGMGVNRSREEKYAAQAAATEIAAEMRKARSGKELDDSLVDIISDEKILVKTSLARAIKEFEDLPEGDDISPEVIDNIRKFVKNINTIEQFEAFVRQMGAMEEYQIPAAYLSSTIKTIKGGLEDLAMEDQEDPDEMDVVPVEDAEGVVSKMDALKTFIKSDPTYLKALALEEEALQRMYAAKAEKSQEYTALYHEWIDARDYSAKVLDEFFDTIYNGYAEDGEHEMAAQTAKVAAMFDQQILDEVNAKVKRYANEPGFDHDTEWAAAMKSVYTTYKVKFEKGQESGDRYEAAKRLFDKMEATQASNLGNVEDAEGKADCETCDGTGDVRTMVDGEMEYDTCPTCTGFQKAEDGEHELDGEVHDMLSQAEDILGNLEDQGHDDLAANGTEGAEGADADAMNMLYNLQDAGWTNGSAAWKLSRDIVAHGRKAMPQPEDGEHGAVQAILQKYPEALKGDEFDEACFDELFTHFTNSGEMPAGTAEGRDGDPEEWILNKLTELGLVNPEESEELTLESVYDTMGFIKAPVMSENGITAPSCSTQQYLAEATEQIMEESVNYTTDYLTEQKETDSYKKATVKSVSFKERFKPKTQSQLEELRRYGL